MDHTDRLSGLRRPARLRHGRLGRRAPAGLTARLLLTLAAALAVLLPGAPAWAHNALAEATPAKNATVKKAPESVKLRFLQKLNPDYTTVTITGTPEPATPTAEVDGATVTVTFAEPLANGAYTVAYQVVSKDGHPVRGSYEFTVDDPDAAAAPASPAPAPASSAPASSAPASSAPASSAPAGPAPVADVSEDDSSGAVLWVVIAVVAALVVGGGLVLARRRRG